MRNNRFHSRRIGGCRISWHYRIIRIVIIWYLCLWTRRKLRCLERIGMRRHCCRNRLGSDSTGYSRNIRILHLSRMHVPHWTRHMIRWRTPYRARHMISHAGITGISNGRVEWPSGIRWSWDYRLGNRVMLGTPDSMWAHRILRVRQY